MPVTASFIIGWVIIGPALLALGVPAPAAAMFVFYYSVLSEVTPPTALAAVAAAAITGGRTVPHDVADLKYALPAFLAPIAFVLTEHGRGPARPRRRCWASCGPRGGVRSAVAALAVGHRRLGARHRPGRRVPADPGRVAGLLLLYLHPVTIAIGARASLGRRAVVATDRDRPRNRQPLRTPWESTTMSDPRRPHRIAAART